VSWLLKIRSLIESPDVLEHITNFFTSPEFINALIETGLSERISEDDMFLLLKSDVVEATMSGNEDAMYFLFKIGNGEINVSPEAVEYFTNFFSSPEFINLLITATMSGNERAMYFLFKMTNGELDVSPDASKYVEHFFSSPEFVNLLITATMSGDERAMYFLFKMTNGELDVSPDASKYVEHFFSSQEFINALNETNLATHLTKDNMFHILKGAAINGVDVREEFVRLLYTCESRVPKFVNGVFPPEFVREAGLRDDDMYSILKGATEVPGSWLGDVRYEFASIMQDVSLEFLAILHCLDELALRIDEYGVLRHGLVLTRASRFCNPYNISAEDLEESASYLILCIANNVPVQPIPNLSNIMCDETPLVCLLANIFAN
ncbi:MAG: hypothetical protein LBQ43_05005, partial [Holosporales bacterium]|nr:hypothetical protein [Holosporales bacterium]